MSERNQLDISCLRDCFVGEALDGMCVGLALTNGAGRVAWMNRAAEGYLGVEKAECLGQPLAQVLKDPQLCEFWNLAVSRGGTLMGEVSTHWPRQSELKCNSAECLDANGEALGRILLCCDVTADRMVQLKLSQEATARLLTMANPFHDEPEPNGGLTGQELRVLRLVGAGLGNQEIADKIDVAPSTVRTHLKHVYQKTGLGSRSEAISYAIHNGLV